MKPPSLRHFVNDIVGAGGGSRHAKGGEPVALGAPSNVEEDFHGLFGRSQLRAMAAGVAAGGRFPSRS
jgi:hypothetical protein